MYIPIYQWDINLGVDLLGHKECLVGILDSFPYWQSVLPEILTAIPLNTRPFPLLHLTGAPPTSVHLLLRRAEPNHFTTVGAAELFIPAVGTEGKGDK